MPLSAAEKQRRCRERRDNDLLRRAEYLQKEQRKKQSRFSKWKKNLIAQLTDREKRHHKCDILPKLIFAIMLYRNAAPFNPVLLL